MERTPKDYDFATDSLPENTVTLLKAAGIRVVETGVCFATDCCAARALARPALTLLPLGCPCGTKASSMAR